MHIRPAKLEDAEALAGLTLELGYSGTADDLRRRLQALQARGSNEVFVACDDEDRPIGWITVVITSSLEADPRAELAGLVVTEAWRSQGVGNKLLAHAQEWASGQGLDVIRVRTNTVRKRTHGFYERLGYELKKEQRVYEKLLK